MSLLKIFDYIYVRVYRYSVKKGDTVPETMGTVVLTLIQCMTIADAVFILHFIFDTGIPSKYAFIPLLVIIGIVNWMRYEKNGDAGQVSGLWRDESKQKRLRNGILIVCYLVITFLIPITYGILKHNLRVI